MYLASLLMVSTRPRKGCRTDSSCKAAKASENQPPEHSRGAKRRASCGAAPSCKRQRTLVSGKAACCPAAVPEQLHKRPCEQQAQRVFSPRAFEPQGQASAGMPGAAVGCAAPAKARARTPNTASPTGPGGRLFAVMQLSCACLKDHAGPQTGGPTAAAGCALDWFDPLDMQKVRKPLSFRLLEFVPALCAAVAPYCCPCPTCGQAGFTGLLQQRRPSSCMPSRLTGLGGAPPGQGREGRAARVYCAGGRGAAVPRGAAAQAGGRAAGAGRGGPRRRAVRQRPARHRREAPLVHRSQLQ